ncbi:MAG TPA: AraC family transcriptional regulator [Methylomirabilota bacterium]|nr:AraC family transcriptional regulator [Methylomirabilota bacterium]
MSLDENPGDLSSVSATIEADDRSGLEAFREAYAEAVMPCGIDLIEDGPATWRLQRAKLGETVVASIESSPMRWDDEPALAERHEPGLMIDVILAGNYEATHNDRHTVVEKGEVSVYSCQIPSLAIARTRLYTRTVLLPERDVRPAIGDLDRVAGLKMPGHLAETRLLASYVEALDPVGVEGSPTLRTMVGEHLKDLVIAGLTRLLHLEDPTAGRGVRAARLARIKRLIDEQIAQPTLNAARLARQVGVSERYVQMLFEEAGTTISAYVMENRLKRAHRILGRDEMPEVAIRDIAYAVGFSDASHFSRAFRRRFGETPGGVRGIGEDIA